MTLGWKTVKQAENDTTTEEELKALLTELHVDTDSRRALDFHKKKYDALSEEDKKAA